MQHEEIIQVNEELQGTMNTLQVTINMLIQIVVMLQQLQQDTPAIHDNIECLLNTGDD